MLPTTVAPEIRFVTRNYERLQGLRLVPSCVNFCAVGLVLALWPSSPSVGLFLGLALPAALLAEAGRRWVNEYYVQTFGSVQGASPLPTAELFLFDRGTSWRSRILPGLAVGLVAGFLTILNIPGYVILCAGIVLWALALTLYLARAGHLETRRYWVVGAVLMSVVSVGLSLPLASLASLHTDTEFFRFLGLVMVLYGLVLLVCSLLDHRLLVRSFAAAAGATRAATL